MYGTILPVAKRPNVILLVIVLLKKCLTVLFWYTYLSLLKHDHMKKRQIIRDLLAIPH